MDEAPPHKRGIEERERTVHFGAFVDTSTDIIENYKVIEIIMPTLIPFLITNYT